MPDNRAALKRIAKLIGLSAGLWIAAMIVIGLTITLINETVGAILVVVLLFFVPFLAISLLIYDLIRIMRDRDPIFWNKTWYKILLVTGVISVILTGFVLYLTTGEKHAVALTQFAYIGPAVAADDSPTGANQTLRQGFHIVGLVLLSVTFFVSGYITFFKEETETNKHRVQLASDIFKTVFGFITGVLTAALK
jgi:hypothetical protein